LLPALLASTQALLADKAYDAQERVLELLTHAGVGGHTAKEKQEGPARI
jgi:hypothetical protein